MLGTLFRFIGLIILIYVMSIVGSILLSSYILELPIGEIILLIIDDILKFKFT